MKKGDIIHSTETRKMRVRDTLKHASNLENDPDRKARLKDCTCVVCYYGSHIGGQAFTHRDCGECGKDMMYGSTCTDKYYLECAAKFQVCKQCGADVNLVNRRKRKDDGSL